MIRQVLTFLLDQERYGLEISAIQEIMEAPQCYYIPNAPAFFQGAINVHGAILPVLDLAKLLGFEVGGRDLRVIVLDGAVGQLALAVSKLCGIIKLAPGEVLPEDPERQRLTCIRERCQVGDEVINLLDISLLLGRLAAE